MTDQAVPVHDGVMNQNEQEPIMKANFIRLGDQWIHARQIDQNPSSNNTTSSVGENREMNS